MLLSASVPSLRSPSAGWTDSALTSHGHIQTTKLGSHLANSNVRLTHVFSSDLSRARKTAEAIVEAQTTKFGKSAKSNDGIRFVQITSLREQDFGSLERCPWAVNPRTTRRHGARKAPKIDRSHQDWRDIESKESLTRRATSFIDTSIVPMMLDPTSARKEPTVAVVSHGMTLHALWKALLKRFALFGVSLGPGVNTRSDNGDNLEHIGGWSNTGYLELDIQHQPSDMKAAQATKGVATSIAPMTTSQKDTIAITVLYDWRMKVLAINNTSHLRGLKRTRGGVGSSTYDEDQKPIESYFKKRRVA